MGRTAAAPPGRKRGATKPTGLAGAVLYLSSRSNVSIRNLAIHLGMAPSVFVGRLAAGELTRTQVVELAKIMRVSPADLFDQASGVRPEATKDEDDDLSR